VLSRIVVHCTTCLLLQYNEMYKRSILALHACCCSTLKCTSQSHCISLWCYVLLLCFQCFLQYNDFVLIAVCNVRNTAMLSCHRALTHRCALHHCFWLLQYDEMYKRSIEDPNGFWGDIAKEFYWEKQVRHRCMGLLKLCSRALQ
jgi:hypothetical protein